MDMKIDNSTLDFLSDWRERMNKQQKRNFWLFIISFILTFVLCLIASFWFQYANTARIVNQNRKYIQDSARQETSHIERDMKDTVLIVQNFAEQYARLIRNGPELTSAQRLEALTDQNLFDRLAFVTPDGLDTSVEGAANVSDRGYFLDAMAGNSGWDFISESRVTGRPSVVFYAPVLMGEDIVGVMSGFYSPDRMDNVFVYDFFNYAPTTYLMRGDGVVITSSKEEAVTDNIMELLSQKHFTGDIDYQDILSYIHDPETRSVTFTYTENSKTYVGVVSQFSGTSNSDWLVLSILPYDVTENMISNANANGLVFLGAIVMVFFFSLLFIQYAFQKMNQRFEDEMALAMNSLYTTMGYERYQMSIIQTLVNVYTSVYCVDLKNGEYQRLKEANPVSVENMPEQGDWLENLTLYCDEFVAESYREDMRHFMQIDQRREQQDADSMESIEYMRSDGRWRRASMIPVKGENGKEATSYVFAVQKIDQEKKKELRTKEALEEAYEAAQLANNAKTSFLSNMSHDIRTPMNAIVGMTAIASAHLNEPDKIADCLKKINISSKHLLGLINEVLDMSKIESGKVDLSEEEFSLSELMDTLVSLNMPLIKEKNHTLLVTVKNLVHEDVVGDCTRLQQVLTNLLTNAIKYTPENGKIEITVAERETNKSTIGWYEIAIKDNGIGMSEEYQQKLFEPFVRASDSRIKGIQGTGLGMPIARNIARMMNGDISVESKLNEGSTFTVSFALKLQTDQDVDYEQFVHLPVLVVDDDIIACESTCTILESLKMDSEWVTTGKEAVARLVEHHEKDDDFYAVIVDWKMPDMDGVDVAKEIRNQIGEDIPIIIMSAYDWMDIEQEARAAGVNAFLSKPLFKSKLVGVFSTLLQDEGRKSKSAVQAASKQVEYNFAGRRILLVEDNEMNREIAVELLNMLGFEMDTAENGKEGVEKFESKEPGYYDVILMDVQMPVMDGYQAAQAIRRLPRMDANTIPIIAMTANAFSSDVRDAYNAGMNAHIAKPIDIQHVAKLLWDQIEKHDIERF